MRNRILIVLGVVAVIGVILTLLGFKMTPDDLHISARAEVLWCLGGQPVGEDCSPGTIIPITNSLVMTLIVDAILVLIIVFVGQRLQMVPRGVQNAVEAIFEFLYNFALGIDRKNIAKFFPLPATIFSFFLIANMIALIPGVGSIGICRPHTVAASESHGTEAAAGEGHATEAVAEAPVTSPYQSFPLACDHHDNSLIPLFRAPAADLNVTLAFALAAGIMIEVFGFQALGLGYLGKFFINPFKEGVMQTFVGLLELLGEFTRIVSFTFRVFGNIFGGEVVLIVMSYLFAFLLPLPFYGLEVFVALIQAVIFAVLTLVFSSQAVQAHGGHDHGTAEAAH